MLGLWDVRSFQINRWILNFNFRCYLLSTCLAESFIKGLSQGPKQPDGCGHSRQLPDNWWRPQSLIICPLKAKLSFNSLSVCTDTADSLRGGLLRRVRVASFCESEISSGWVTGPELLGRECRQNLETCAWRKWGWWTEIVGRTWVFRGVRAQSHQMRIFAYDQEEEDGAYRKRVSLCCWVIMDQSQEMWHLWGEGSWQV